MGTGNYMHRHSFLGTTRVKELFLYSVLGSSGLKAAAVPAFRASQLSPAVQMRHSRRQYVH